MVRFKFSFLRFPEPTVTTILIFVLLLVCFILILMLLGLLRSYIRMKKMKEYFFRETMERGLTEEETEILWKYSLKLGRDPFLTLEFKAPFEKVVDLYLRTDPNPKEKLIQEMRVKLGFDYVPYFVPLVSTKDIELFQPARLYTPEGGGVDVSLFDKDERFMYWAVVDKKRLPNVKGERVSISFIRKGDGIYKVEEEVTDVFKDSGRQVLKIPHTFELMRFQRREHARVEVEFPAQMGVVSDEGIRWIEASIVDISAGGAKVCVSKEVFSEQLKDMSEIILKFDIEGRNFEIRSKVVNFYHRRKHNCYGVKFEDIKSDEQKFIYDFVKKEQQKLAQLTLRSRG
jgi:c-di-GMP-binding flagellar brake protein YcgR